MDGSKRYTVYPCGALGSSPCLLSHSIVSIETKNAIGTLEYKNTRDIIFAYTIRAKPKNELFSIFLENTSIRLRHRTPDQRPKHEPFRPPLRAPAPLFPRTKPPKNDTYVMLLHTSICPTSCCLCTHLSHVPLEAVVVPLPCAHKNRNLHHVSRQGALSSGVGALAPHRRQRIKRRHQDLELRQLRLHRLP